MSEPVSIQVLLKKEIRSRNLEKQVNAAQVCYYFRKWASTAWAPASGGGTAAPGVEPQSYKDAVLWVHVKDSVWAHQMHLKKTSFEAYLKTVCPDIPLQTVRTTMQSA